MVLRSDSKELQIVLWRSQNRQSNKVMLNHTRGEDEDAHVGVHFIIYRRYMNDRKSGRCVFFSSARLDVFSHCNWIKLMWYCLLDNMSCIVVHSISASTVFLLMSQSAQHLRVEISDEVPRHMWKVWYQAGVLLCLFFLFVRQKWPLWFPGNVRNMELYNACRPLLEECTCRSMN